MVWRRFDEGCSVRILHPQRFCDPLWHLVSRLPACPSCTRPLLQHSWRCSPRCRRVSCLPRPATGNHRTLCTPRAQLRTITLHGPTAGGPPGELPAVPRGLQLVPHASRHAGLCTALVSAAAPPPQAAGCPCTRAAGWDAGVPAAHVTNDAPPPFLKFPEPSKFCAWVRGAAPTFFAPGPVS